MTQTQRSKATENKLKHKPTLTHHDL